MVPAHGYWCQHMRYGDEKGRYEMDKYLSDHEIS